MKRQPRDSKILELWKSRQRLYERITTYDRAISALQELCEHSNEEDVSRHGSPDMECPDCGRGMLP